MCVCECGVCVCISSDSTIVSTCFDYFACPYVAISLSMIIIVVNYLGCRVVSPNGFNSAYINYSKWQDLSLVFLDYASTVLYFL